MYGCCCARQWRTRSFQTNTRRSSSSAVTSRIGWIQIMCGVKVTRLRCTEAPEKKKKHTLCRLKRTTLSIDTTEWHDYEKNTMMDVGDSAMTRPKTDFCRSQLTASLQLSPCSVMTDAGDSHNMLRKQNSESDFCDCVEVVTALSWFSRREVFTAFISVQILCYKFNLSDASVTPTNTKSQCSQAVHLFM